MKHILILLVGCFLCLLPNTPAIGENVSPSVVAIVDVSRILQESSAAKAVRQQIEAQSSKFQALISREEQSLRAKEKKLAILREGAATDEYSKEEQKLRKRFLFVERQVQLRRKELDQAYNKAMKDVRAAIIDIVKRAAKKDGINLVIVKQQVIWHDQVVDITDIVLRSLNKELPNIKIKKFDGNKLFD